MKREDLVKSPDYWLAKLQISLYNISHKDTDGDYDKQLSEFYKYSLSLGYVPMIKFVPIDEVLQKETQ